jgi:diguanylate cyclase (GGDEF)-like protein
MHETTDGAEGVGAVLRALQATVDAAATLDDDALAPAESVRELRALGEQVARVVARLAGAPETRIGGLGPEGIDPLTGLPNRRSVDESAAATPGAAVIVVDVDHFSSIIEGWGAAAADQVVCLVAAAIQRSVRADDVVARLDRDRFLVLAAPVAPDDDARSVVAERIRRSVVQIDLAEVAPGHFVTISAGAALHADGRRLADSAARAESALLEAKATGRNRVVVDEGGS